MIIVLYLSGINHNLIAQATWYKYPANPVFEYGTSDEWDEAKFALVVLLEDGQYNMWYKGWLIDLPYPGYGFASSPDGIHWEKHASITIDFVCPESSWDTGIVSFDIIKIDTMYHMWYIGVAKMDHAFCVGYAWSNDGMNWIKHPEMVMNPGKGNEWDNDGIYGVKVLYNGSHFHMWYNGKNKGKHSVRRIGYAISDDGIHWKKHFSNPVMDVGELGAWDDQVVGAYSMNYNGSNYEMWYFGSNLIQQEIGYALSNDGIHWNKSPGNPVLKTGELGAWDSWLTKNPIVMVNDTTYKLWYYGHDNSRGNIGYATTSLEEVRSWDRANIKGSQKVIRVQVFNRLEYIKVDSLTEILAELSDTELIDAMNKLALAYSLNDSKKSLNYARSALDLAEKINYPKGKAMALYSIGNVQYVIDNYSDALSNQLSALSLFDSLQMNFEYGNILSQTASIHSYAGSYDLASRYYEQALQLFEGQNDSGSIVQSLLYLGYSYLMGGDTSSAIAIFKRRLSIANTSRSKWDQVYTLEALGLCYSGRNLDSALYYFNEANMIWITLNGWGYQVYNFIITAEAYISAGPEYYDEAEKYYLKCYEGYGSQKQNRVRMMYGMANLYFLKGRYDKSLQDLDICLQMCNRFLYRQNHNMFTYLNQKLEYDRYMKSYMEKIYWLYYKLDTALKNKEAAFKHFQLATQWKDSIYDQQNRRQWAMLQGLYEAESTQNQIAFLEKDNEVKNLSLKKSRIYLFGLVTITLIIILGAIIVIRNRKIREQYAIEIERVKSEKLQELDHLKSRFFANISHEFRTPLTLIMGPLDRVLSRSEDKNDKKELSIAKKYARNLQNLINNLLSISKLESGKMLLCASEIDIVKFVSIYIQSFESLAKQKNIELKFTSENKIIKAFIDREKFEQVLNNLLSNAFKFTDEGGRIEVSIITNSKNENRKTKSENVSISISDTGRGIAPEHIDHIFNRFYQVNQDDKSYYEGTGIGLALTKELVDLHHGNISVESKPETGTTFTVVLPLGKEHLKPEEIVDTDEPAKLVKSVESFEHIDQFTETSIQETSLEDDAEKENPKPLLLVVEDNDDLRSYILSYLTPDYRITQAVDGEMGLDKAIEHIPDLVVSDVMMPKMDGYQLCQNLRTDERTSHIPIILLTARASMESRIEGLETGADDFITKPFEPLELLIRIKNLIKQRKLLQERFIKNIQKMGIDQLVKIDTPDLTSMDQSFLQKVTEYIIQNISNIEFNVEILGDKMALSRRQLQRKLISITGHSPSMFIRSVRLNRAAELLRNKTGNVTEIAYDVGFNNLSWFAKSFKEQFGVLPSEYPPEKSK